MFISYFTRALALPKVERRDAFKAEPLKEETYSRLSR
jgi:hypothetical protein